MKRVRLEESYVLKAPANWRGIYITSNSRSDGSYSWYKDGDNKKVNFPHVTVSVLPHETDVAGEWIGFHVSVPNGGQNNRYNYRIENGTAVYANPTTKGMIDVDAVHSFRKKHALMLDAFAREFVRAAYSAEADSQMLAGVKQLLAEQR